MTAAQAYIRRGTALRYLQHISRNPGTFDPVDRDKKVQAAREAYQQADAAYRKLAHRNRG